MGLICRSGYPGIAASIRGAEYEKDLVYALLRITPDLWTAETTQKQLCSQPCGNGSARNDHNPSSGGIFHVAAPVAILTSPTDRGTVAGVREHRGLTAILAQPKINFDRERGTRR